MGDEKARARPVSQCQVMKWENGRRETYVQDASKRIWQADKLWQFESIFFILKELKIGKEKDWLGNNRQEEPTIQLRESSKRVIRQLDFKRARIRETGSKYSLLPWPKKQKKKEALCCVWRWRDGWPSAPCVSAYVCVHQARLGVVTNSRWLSSCVLVNP